MKNNTEITTSKEPVALAVARKRKLVLEGDPEAQLAFATKAANALMTVVHSKKNPVIIQGKQYLEFGDWQVLGRFYGATVEIEWTKLLDKGYEARAVVKRNGETVSSAEGMCTRDERRWKTADDYAIRSMAQTRTAAKALRNAFGWVAELAGYSATPAEEMDSVKEVVPAEPVSDEMMFGAQERLEACTTIEELKRVWADIPPTMRTPLTDLKEKMKAKLIPSEIEGV